LRARVHRSNLKNNSPRLAAFSGYRRLLIQKRRGSANSGKEVNRVYKYL
jgi:hypothetical protein